MKLKSEKWIVILGSVVGLIAYSFNEDDKMILGIPAYLFSWLLMSLGAFIGSFLIQIYIQRSPPSTALRVSLGIVLGVILRISFDLLFGTSSHNLFPLEIIISSIIILPSAFAGAYLARLIQIFKK